MTLLTVGILTLMTHTQAQNLAIIPEPVSVRVGQGAFVLNASTKISAGARERVEALKWAAALRPATGYALLLTASSIRGANEIRLDLDESLDYYNNEQTHQGKMSCGRTPMET